MGNPRLLISNQQLLSFRYHRRINRIGDWSPETRAEEEEGERRPEGVCDETDKDIVEGLAFGEEYAVGG